MLSFIDGISIIRIRAKRENFLELHVNLAKNCIKRYIYPIFMVTFLILA